jgi:hypothetical protein
LGAAFYLVIVTSGLSGDLHSMAVETGSISDILVDISDNLSLFRLSILAVLLYVVLSKHNRIIALVALGWWLAEAITLAVSKFGALALIPVSQDFVDAGASAPAYLQTLGEFLYDGLDRQGYTMHMLFYCIGGIVWYYLFFASRYIPRPIALLGLIAASVGLVGTAFDFFGDVPIAVFLPIGVFELIVGAWLMARGIRDDSET